MNIISEIQKLNLPPQEYVVISGAAMAARGLKETDDIDIIVTESVMADYRTRKGWFTHPRIIPTEEAGLANADGTVQLYPTVGGIDISFEELRRGAEMIEGIPFASLNDIIRIKEAYAREKDLSDVEKIKKYFVSK